MCHGRLWVLKVHAYLLRIVITSTGPIRDSDDEFQYSGLDLGGHQLVWTTLDAITYILHGMPVRSISDNDI